MKVSRLSLPVNSPAQREATGRVYLDMISGILNVTPVSGISVPVGASFTAVTNVATEAANLTPSNVGQLYVKSFATAHTLAIPNSASFVVGSKITVVNGGAGELTISAAGTLTGTATVAADAVVTLVYVATNSWRVLA